MASIISSVHVPEPDRFGVNTIGQMTEPDHARVSEIAVKCLNPSSKSSVHEIESLARNLTEYLHRFVKKDANGSELARFCKKSGDKTPIENLGRSLDSALNILFKDVHAHLKEVFPLLAEGDLDKLTGSLKKMKTYTDIDPSLFNQLISTGARDPRRIQKSISCWAITAISDPERRLRVVKILKDMGADFNPQKFKYQDLQKGASGSQSRLIWDQKFDPVEYAKETGDKALEEFLIQYQAAEGKKSEAKEEKKA